MVLIAVSIRNAGPLSGPRYVMPSTNFSKLEKCLLASMRPDWYLFLKSSLLIQLQILDPSPVEI